MIDKPSDRDGQQDFPVVPEPPPLPPGHPRILRALGSYNYRLWFGGQSISLIGTWVQRVTVSWVVWRMTHNALLLGLVGFSGQIFTFALSPIAGVLTDRLSRYRIMLVTQTLSLVQAAIMASLALTGQLAVWEIFALSACLGAINAFDVPARQSFTVEMVEDPGDLSNAIALNSIMVNGGRMVGPPLAGILLKFVGEGMSFLVNALSFVFVIAALLLMRVTPRPMVKRRKAMWSEILEGLAYVRGHVPIRTVLVLLALTSLVAMPYQQLMPIFAQRIFHGGPATLGYLMGASGVGAIFGSFLLASLEDTRILPKLLLVALLIFGVALVAFSASQALPLALLILVFSGFGMMVQITSSNTFLQTVVEDSKRGRVMSLYTMAFFGMGPWGSLLSGALANQFGAPLAIAISGAICLLGGAVFCKTLWSLRVEPLL
ncbi:MAG: MFS transporter [Cyanobacteria bacterium REEB65]|nr:MFS transporter [Cyanobacteria bacterium REEB65]